MARRDIRAEKAAKDSRDLQSLTAAVATLERAMKHVQQAQREMADYLVSQALDEVRQELASLQRKSRSEDDAAG